MTPYTGKFTFVLGVFSGLYVFKQDLPTFKLYFQFNNFFFYMKK